MNILVVDDHLIIRKLVTEILKKMPEIEKIHIAENGIKAVEILKEENIDLLLLDLLMPKMNGFEVLDYMTKENMNNIPIIVFSTDESQKFIAFDKGAHEFLHKPISENKLKFTIEKYIKLLA